MIAAKPIDTTNLNRAIHALARLPGARLDDVIDHEAARILEGALRGTSAAAINSIRERENTRAFRTIDAGNGRKTYNVRDHRFPDALWLRLEQARKAVTISKTKSKGFAKRSWLLLAQSAGLFLTKVPGYVSKATVSQGKTFSGDLASRRTRSSSRGGIFFSNANPVTRFSGGRAALLKAINGRVGYFRRSLKAGAFTSLARIARAYPGLRLGNPS